MNLECDNEETIDLKVKSNADTSNKHSNYKLEDEIKYSFYKIKKNRILKEFIQILRKVEF